MLGRQRQRKVRSMTPLEQLPDPSLAELDARYRGALMAYFRRRTTSTAEAEDLTQEVFLRILRQGDVQTVTAVDRYIFTVAANLLRDRARRARTRSSHRHDSLEIRQDADAQQGLVEILEPERILLSRDKLARTLRALDAVGARTRGVFLLYRLEGMKQREIAQLLGISVSAVEKHIVKALKQLARELA
jgi:RNA polymerase sigma-70 factor (ECF subfamily)